MVPNGLKELTQEDRDKNSKYHVSGLVNLSKKEADEYFVKNPMPFFPSTWVLDQGEFHADNDECAPISLSRLMSFLNGYHISPHFLAMMTRLRNNQPLDDFGHSIRDVMDTGRKVGALKIEDELFSFKDRREVIYDSTQYKNINELTLKANNNITGAYTWIEPTNGMDYFDTFRATIAKFNKLYGKNHGGVFGMRWNYPLDQVYLDKPVQEGTGHAIPLIYAVDNYAPAIQSYGLKAGKGGIQYIHRDIINKWASAYGLAVPIDASKEEVDALLARGGKLDDPWYINAIQAIWRRILSLLRGNVSGVMLWDTPSHIRRNVRVMCDEAGIPYSTKNVICAIIKQESNWSPKAIGKPNFNGTRDYGLVQINDGKNKEGVPYWIGKGAYFSSVEEVLNNPKKGVELLIQMAKEKRLWLWSSYKFGHYKKWLPSESLPSIPY